MSPRGSASLALSGLNSSWLVWTLIETELISLPLLLHATCIIVQSISYLFNICIDMYKFLYIFILKMKQGYFFL